MAISVTVYGRPDRVCLRCKATKEWMKRHGVPYRFVNVDTDPASEAFIRELGALEVPVVVVLDGTKEDTGSEFWAGHRIPKLQELARRLAEPDAA